MISISLMDALNVFSSNGVDRYQAAKDAASEGDYSVAQDPYKQAREGIVRNHKLDGGVEGLAAAIGTSSNPTKAQYLPKIIAGYGGWWKKKELVLLPTASGIYTSHGVEVRVKPDLCLEVDGTPYHLKLYFRKDPLMLRHAKCVCRLMEKGLPDETEQGDRVGLVDCQEGKLLSTKTYAKDLDATIEQDLKFIASVAVPSDVGSAS